MARYTLPVITSFETPKRYRKRNIRIKCYFNMILTCGKTNILPFLFPASCTFILKFEFKFKQFYHILFFPLHAPMSFFSIWFCISFLFQTRYRFMCPTFSHLAVYMSSIFFIINIASGNLNSFHTI